MADTVVYIRRGDEVRRLVGPHAATVAKQRAAEGWERFTPEPDFDASAPATPRRAPASRAKAKSSGGRKRAKRPTAPKEPAPPAPGAAVAPDVSA